MRGRLFLPWSLLAGLLALVVATEGLKATALVLGKLKAKPTPEPAAVSEEAEGVTEADAEGSNSSSTRSLLTGIPQLDYVHDPNLPRELNGYNLTEYPFYDRVPEDLDFKCDGLHDGFYASVQHKCQVYHHCLFGTRYDFLCANYTAFDQKTFICHFVSEVDCVNSHKYFKRNEALYKAATTTTPSTTTTQAAPPPPPPPQRRPQRPGGRRRPYRRRPVYEYYYDDDYDEDYYDEVPATGKESGVATGPGRHFKNQSRRLTPVSEPEHDSTHSEDTDTPQEPTADVKPRTSSVYDRPRVPPKIRRPVPINERDKYEYVQQKPTPAATSDERVQSSNSRPKQNAKTSTPAPEAEDEFYDDEEEYVAPPRSSASGSRRKNQPSEYYPTAPEREVVRRPVMSAGRNVRRKGPGGRRRGSGQVDTATMYTPIEDEDYEEEELPRRPVRPSGGRRRAHVSYRDEYGSQSRQPTRSKYEDEEEDEDPVPAPRPAYISPSGGSRQAYVVRKRVQPQQPDVLPTAQGGYKRSGNNRKQPHPATAYAEEEDDEEYYDDDEEEEPESVYQPRSRQTSRPSVQSNFGPTAGDSQQRQSPNKRPYSSSRAGSASSPRTSQVQSGKISYENVKDEESVKQVRGQTQGQIFDDIRDASSTVRPKVTRGKFTSNVNDEFSEEVKSDPPSLKPADNEKLLPANNGRSTFEEQPGRTFPTSFSNFRNKFQPTGLGGSKPRTNTETEKISDGFTSPAKTETVDNTNSEPKTVSTIPSKPGHGSPVLTKVIVKPLGGRTVDIPDSPEKNNLADLNEHDIDVTINDALHPTLHPTRSIASEFVPRTQEETQRGSGLKRPTSSTRYQSQNSDAINRSPSQLVSSQSQRLITRAPFDAQSKFKQPYDDSDTSIETSSPQSTNVQYNEPQNVRRQPQLRYQQVNIPVSSLGTGFINVQSRHQQRPLHSQ